MTGNRIVHGAGGVITENHIAHGAGGVITGKENSLVLSEPHWIQKLSFVSLGLKGRQHVSLCNAPGTHGYHIHKP
jgi:hypothetical protein